MPSKRRLFIASAGSLGREMESWLSLLDSEKLDWHLEGFLHSSVESSPLIGFPSHLDIVGSWEDYKFSSEDLVVLAVADPLWKQRIWNHLFGTISFFTYVAPSAVLGKFNVIGEGSIIAPNCVVTSNVAIGEAVTVNSSCGIGHDSKLGSFSSIMSRVTVAGKVSIGSKVMIGSGATLAPGVSVGDGAVIGLGSVVIRDVKNGHTVYGNPAKSIWSSQVDSD